MKFHELADIFPLMSGSEFEQLKQDIAENGVIEPLVMFESQILDGRNRYRAAQEVGADFPCIEYEGNDPAAYVVSLNLHRRHLNESQRAMVAAKLANLELGANQHNSASANLQTQTRAEAADLLNVSERTVNAAKKVQKEGSEPLQSEVEQGNVSVSAAADVATLPQEEQEEIIARGQREILQAAKQIRAERTEKRRQERIDKISELAQGNKKLDIEKTYPVIYADPPWKYDYSPTDEREIENQYPVMSLEAIKALPINKLATSDAILFLWATSPKLQESLEVVNAWGFSYRTCAVWDKQKIGMGYYFRQQHELLLVATRGDIPVPAPADRPSSVISIPYNGHSIKPEVVAEMIEAMYPEFPKIELFCRSPRDGWDVWGNQSAA